MLLFAIRTHLDASKKHFMIAQAILQPQSNNESMDQKDRTLYLVKN
jgi:hypothetical protein